MYVIVHMFAITGMCVIGHICVITGMCAIAHIINYIKADPISSKESVFVTVPFHFLSNQAYARLPFCTVDARPGPADLRW
jgi:hypothetical protein